jgi:HSP20 family protein
MLTRRMLDPMWPFMQLRRDISQLFSGFDETDGGASMRAGFPPLNIWEDENAYYAEAEIPGVTQDELEIFTVGSELTIRGSRKPTQGENVSYHRQERGTGEFVRVVSLPGEVDAGKVEANLHNGVLTLTLPKVEAAKPRKIAVSTK